MTTTTTRQRATGAGRAAKTAAKPAPDAKKPAAKPASKDAKTKRPRSTTPPPAPPAEPPPPDLRDMVAAQKRITARALEAGSAVPAGDLQAIAKMEQRFAEDDTFERLRKMTSYRSAGRAS